MQTLIDGHNLIPFLPDMSLADIDDEKQLMSMLQIHARMSRSHIEVYFDNAPEGHPRRRKVGMITVHSVPRPAIADTAIIERVRSLKRTASAWCVVSHDRSVQDACRRMGARIVDSPEYAQSIMESLRKNQKKIREQPELADDEINEWIRVFGEGKGSGRAQD